MVKKHSRDIVLNPNRLVVKNALATSTLQGGVGNIMFQVAAAYTYSKRFNKELFFCKERTIAVHKNIESYENSILKDLEFSSFIPSQVQINENGFHYQELQDYPGKNIILHGYFQSEKYFQDHSDEIRDLFMSYKIDIGLELQEILKNENTCSIHVRRGDYLNSPNHHPTQNMNYYMRAIKEMPKDSVFLIFSDDIKWCKENFPSLPEKFIFVEGNKDYEDLYLMTHCKNNIIANSTFSWWGAWLNSNSDKIVVAPKKWFGPALKNNDTKDLYCEDWIII